MKKEEKPENNIQWVGKRTRLDKETGKPKVVARDMPEFVPDGNEIIKLPKPDSQMRFYHEEKDRLITLFPEDFKPIVDKGGKTK